MGDIQRFLTNELSRPNKRIVSSENAQDRTRNISSDAPGRTSTVIIDSTRRRPEPILGSTGEKFHISNDYLNDRRVTDVINATLPGREDEMVGSLKSLSTALGQTYNPDTMFQELLEMMRPKYSVLTPEPNTELDRLNEDNAAVQDGIIDEGYRVMQKAANDLNCEITTTRDDDIVNVDQQHSSVPELNVLNAIASMESALNVPDEFRLGARHPSSSIRAVQSEVEDELAEERKKRHLNFEKLSGAQAVPSVQLETEFIGQDKEKLPIAPDLLRQLNMITPRHLRLHSSHSAQDSSNSRLYDPGQSTASALKEAWTKNLQDARTYDVLDKISLKMGQVVEPKGNGVYEYTDEHDALVDTLDAKSSLPPLLYRKQLFEYEENDAPVDWSAYSYSQQINPCGELKFHQATDYHSELVLEKSIADVLQEINLARGKHYGEQRAKKAADLLAKKREEEEQQREYQSDLLTRVDSRLGHADDSSKSPSSNLQGSLKQPEALFKKVSEREMRQREKALRRMAWAEALVPERSSHYESFPEWLTTKVLPTLRFEVELCQSSCPPRPYTQHLRRVYELQPEYEDLTEWSDTDQDDFSERMMKQGRPDFDNLDVLKKLIKEDKEERERLKLKNLEKRIMVTPRDTPSTSTRLHEQSLSSIFCTKILYQGWIRQSLIPSYQGFLWGVCYETGLVAYEVPINERLEDAFPKEQVLHPSKFPVVLVMSFNEGVQQMKLEAPNINKDTLTQTKVSFHRDMAHKVAAIAKLAADPIKHIQSTCPYQFTITGKHFPVIDFASDSIRFCFICESTVEFSLWLRALSCSWAYCRHARRMADHISPGLELSLTSLRSNNIDLSNRQVDIQELCLVLNDLNADNWIVGRVLPAATAGSRVWSLLDSVNLSVCDLTFEGYKQLTLGARDWKIRYWNFSQNKRLGNIAPLFENFPLDTASLDYSECALEDTIELGEAVAKLLNRCKLIMLNLQGNKLGDKFIEGFASHLNDRMPEIRRSSLPTDLRKTHLILAENPHITNHGARQLLACCNRVPSLRFVNMNGCPMITTLPKLVGEFPDLMLLDHESTETAEHNSHLDLFLLPYRIGVAHSAYIKESIFPRGFLSTTLPKLAVSCHVISIINCTGDLCLVSSPEVDDAAFIDKLDLSLTQWDSEDTKKSTEECCAQYRRGGNIDARLENILLAVKQYRIRHLILDVASPDAPNVPKEDIGVFIASLIAETDLELIQLDGFNLSDTVLKTACQKLAAKRTLDEAEQAEYLSSELVTFSVQKSGVIHKRRRSLTIESSLDTSKGGLSRQWKLRRLSLNHCANLDSKALEVLFRILWLKAPLLCTVSMLDTSIGSISFDIQGFDHGILNVSDELVAPAAISDSDCEPAEGSDYNRLIKAYYETKANLKHLTVSDAEAAENKLYIINKWVKRTEEFKRQRRIAKRRLRKRQLMKLIQKAYSKSLTRARGALSRRMPATIDDLRDSIRQRYRRRLQRMEKQELNEGVYPPYRVPPLVYLELYKDHDGISIRPKTEFDCFLSASDRILDLSGCLYDSYTMESFFHHMSLLNRGEPMRLDALSLVNTGFDTDHLVDLAKMLSVYDIRCGKLDLSVNRIEVDKAAAKEALLTVIINLQLRCLILDCNMIMDVKNFGEVIVNAVTMSVVEIISIRHNRLGKYFLRQVIRKLDELLLPMPTKTKTQTNQSDNPISKEEQQLSEALKVDSKQVVGVVPKLDMSQLHGASLPSSSTPVSATSRMSSTSSSTTSPLPKDSDTSDPMQILPQMDTAELVSLLGDPIPHTDDAAFVKRSLDGKLEEYQQLKPKPIPESVLDVTAEEKIRFVRRYRKDRKAKENPLKVLDMRENADFPKADLHLLATKLKKLCPFLEEIRIDDVMDPQHELPSLMKRPEHVGLFVEEPELMKLKDVEVQSLENVGGRFEDESEDRHSLRGSTTKNDLIEKSVSVPESEAPEPPTRAAPPPEQKSNSRITVTRKSRQVPSKVRIYPFKKVLVKKKFS